MSTRPVLVYDGDCGFCTRCVAFVERRLGVDAKIVAFQHADLAPLGLTVHHCERAVQWVEPSGRIYEGHTAVGQILLTAGWPWAALGWLARTPPFSWCAALIYRWVAANRHRLPGGTPACAMPAHERPGARIEDGAR